MLVVVVGVVVGAVEVAAEAARAGFAAGFGGAALGQDASEAFEGRPEFEHAVRTLVEAVGSQGSSSKACVAYLPVGKPLHDLVNARLEEVGEDVAGYAVVFEVADDLSGDGPNWDAGSVGGFDRFRGSARVQR